MIKAILKIVCVLMFVNTIANAQTDSSMTLTEADQSKGVEVNTWIAIGEVIEADITHEFELSMVYLEIIDELENDYYFTASNVEQDFEALSNVSEDIIGKMVKATYTKNIVKEIVEYRPAALPEGVANRGKEVDEKIIVYTIKGTQESAIATDEGWEVTFRTENGTIINFLADEMVFNGHTPTNFDGTKINISYIEIENFILKDLEIID